MTEPVLILGGRSDIGRAIAHRFAAAVHPVTLAARNAATLEEDCADISVRYGVEVRTIEFDVLDTGTMAGFIDGLGELPDIVVCVVGAMGEQAASERDAQAAALVMRSNYEGPALILGLFAERMAVRGRGTIVGISSVAGDRGRATNYVYGSAKAGFTAFLSGLRNRLAGQGVHVVTVKPGFVATRMTEGMDLPGALTAAPQEVAETVFRATLRRRDVVYIRWIWWPMMTAIRAIPERVFKRMKL